MDDDWDFYRGRWDDNEQICRIIDDDYSYTRYLNEFFKGKTCGTTGNIIDQTRWRYIVDIKNGGLAQKRTKLVWADADIEELFGNQPPAFFPASQSFWTVGRTLEYNIVFCTTKMFKWKPNLNGRKAMGTLRVSSTRLRDGSLEIQGFVHISENESWLEGLIPMDFTWSVLGTYECVASTHEGMSAHVHDDAWHNSSTSIAHVQVTSPTGMEAGWEARKPPTGIVRAIDRPVALPLVAPSNGSVGSKKERPTVPAGGESPLGR